MHTYNDVKQETYKTEGILFKWLSKMLKIASLYSWRKKKGKMVVSGRNLSSTLEMNYI